MGWGRAREQRRWQRELERQLGELPTFEDDTPDGGPVAPLDRRLPSPPRPRGPRRAPRVRTGSERRRTVLTVGVTGALVLGLLAFNAGPWAGAVRGLVGWDGDRGSTSSYEFLQWQELSDEPVTWSSCAPISYAVNDTGAPSGWRSTLDDAIEAVSDATGLKFLDQGLTADRAFDRRFDGLDPLPVLIGWASPAEVPMLEDDVVGLARPDALVVRSRGVRTAYYVTGIVVFDIGAFTVMERSGEVGLQRAVMAHELGHLVGLDHVDDELQLMFPTTTFQSTFGSGDLEGLERLGDGPCVRR